MNADETRNRPLRRPAVEVAAMRNAQVLRSQQLMQRTWNAIAVGIVVAAGYFFAEVGWLILGLMVVAGVLAGSAITHLRSFGERSRVMGKIMANLEEEAARTWQIQKRVASRVVLGELLFGTASSLGAVVWAGASGGRWWVVLLGILVLVYARSCMKMLASDRAAFMRLTAGAQESDCQIGLFRRFREGPSSLARSALVPILAGYGKVHIVVDKTLVQTTSEGVFGGQVGDLAALCEVHQFSNTEWKDRVAEIIQDCDVAVIDAAQILEECDVENFEETAEIPGLVWELAQCYMHLPPYRVYLALDAEALEGTTIEQLTRNLYEVLGMRTDMPRNVRPYFFLFSPSAWQQETLANDLHRKMCEIVAIEEGDMDASQYYGDS
jgi:hypothetical protein